MLPSTTTAAPVACMLWNNLPRASLGVPSATCRHHRQRAPSWRLSLCISLTNKSADRLKTDAQTAQNENESILVIDAFAGSMVHAAHNIRNCIFFFSISVIDMNVFQQLDL